MVRSGKHRTRSSSPPSTSTSSSSTSPFTSSSSSPPSIEYAIKIIDRTKLKEQDVLALRDEVAILTSLRECEHVIRLYDYFDEPPHRSYLVLEVMAGGELFDRIVSKSYYNEREARDTCRTLLEAVHYCHRRRVAHRDLKPENLLLTSASDDSGVKIADFGFAKVVRSPRSLRTQCGTPVRRPSLFFLPLARRRRRSPYSSPFVRRIRRCFCRIASESLGGGERGGWRWGM